VTKLQMRVVLVVLTAAVAYAQAAEPAFAATSVKPVPILIAAAYGLSFPNAASFRRSGLGHV